MQQHHKLFHYQDKQVNEKLSRTIFISMVQKFSTWSTTKMSTILWKKKHTHKSYTPTSAFDSRHFFFFFIFVHAYKSSNGVNKTCKQYREKYKQERKCFEIVNAFRGYFNRATIALFPLCNIRTRDFRGPK